ncbi:MAG: OB-fold domain-containing protein [Porphyrobacter sp.]|nr:OB-fold domain-containing protein [Porphyrobacter sp.]
MSAETGILSFGAYLPRHRLQRSAIHAANGWFAAGLKGLAQGERATANWDEDALTMAVEAARDTLKGIDRAGLGSLSLASTSLPFVDRLNSGVIKEALTLADATGAFDVTGGQRVATSALIQALAAAAGGARPHLALASEMRLSRPASEAEMNHGDAAAGLLVGQGDLVARFLGSHSTTVDFVDHFRMSGQDFDYTWESRWIRDEGYTGLIGGALKEAFAHLGVAGESIDRFIVPITARGVAEGLARRAGVKPEAVADRLAGSVGDTGVAHPFLLFAAALEQAQAGETIALIGFGQGVDVLLFEATGRALAPRRGVTGSLARGVPTDNYMRWLFHRGNLKLDRGMRAEFDQKQPGTTLWRQRKAVLGLVGGRCTMTGTVQFPKSVISVNPNDHAAHTQEDYPLAERKATILTYTADSLTYSPAPPSFYGMIDFEGGGRLMAEFTDADADDVDVGREVEMMFRIKGVDEMRDFTKYFWKAVPVR